MPIHRLTAVAKTFLQQVEATLGPLPTDVQRALAKRAAASPKRLDIDACAAVLLRAMPSVDQAKLITAAFDRASVVPSGQRKGSRVLDQIATAMTPRSSASRSAGEPLPAKVDFTLDVVYVGDSHSNMRNAARAATVYKTAIAQSEDVIAIHTGDVFMGTPLFEVGGHGVAEMKILREMGVRYYVVGNHDLDEGEDGLMTALKVHPKLEVLVANWELHGELAKRVKPYATRMVDGHKVAIIGVSMNPADYGFKRKSIVYKDPADTLRRLIPEIKAKEKTSSIIVISHLGASVDKELSGYFPEVDAWIGGHSHTTMKYPDRRTHEDGSMSLVAHAGANYEKVGILALGFKDGHIAARSGTLMPVGESIQEDAGVVKVLRSYDQKLKDFGEVLATSKMIISGRARRSPDTRLGNLVTDVIREELSEHHKKVDIAIFNRTGLRASLPRGEITLGHLFELFPFGNTMCTVELTGAQVQEMLDHSAGRGGDAVSGVTYTIRAGKAADVQVDGKPLDPKKRYTIGANSYMVQKLGSGYSVFAGGKHIEDSKLQIRQLLINYFREKKEIEPPREVEIRTKVADFDSADAIRERLGIVGQGQRRSWQRAP